MGEPEILMLTESVAKASRLGFDAYCTDCESATIVTNGRCACGSGRIATPASLREYLANLKPAGAPDA